MRLDGNQGSTLGYEPNSYGEWQEQPGFREPSLALDGAADHWNHRQDEDYYSQPSLLFRLMNPQQRKVLETPPAPWATPRGRSSSGTSTTAEIRPGLR